MAFGSAGFYLLLRKLKFLASLRDLPASKSNLLPNENYASNGSARKDRVEEQHPAVGWVGLGFSVALLCGGLLFLGATSFDYGWLALVSRRWQIWWGLWLSTGGVLLAIHSALILAGRR
jgi:hypothetical protein